MSHPLATEPAMLRASAMIGQIVYARKVNASWCWDALAVSLDEYERQGGTVGHLAVAASLRACECLQSELERSVAE